MIPALLALLALLATLTAVTLLPVAPHRDMRAAALLLGLVLVLAARWRNPWRLAIVASAVLAHVASGLRPEGWATVLGLYLAGELVDFLACLEVCARSVLLGAFGVLGCVVALDALGALATGREPVGLLGDTSTTGTYLGMVAPAIAFLWPPAVALVPAALWGAHSTAGWLAAGLGLLAWVAMRRGLTWPVVGVTAAATVTLVLLADPAAAGPWIAKLGVWHATLGSINGSAWLVGAGPGSFAALGLHAPGEPVWAQAHNELVQWAYEAGALGVVAVIGYGVSLARVLARARIDHAAPVAAMLVGFAVASCGHFVARLAATAAVGIVACGLAEAVGREVAA